MSWKLSPSETICLKCQNLFSGKTKKKYFKTLSAENLIQHAMRKAMFTDLMKSSPHLLPKGFQNMEAIQLVLLNFYQLVLSMLGKKNFSRQHFEIFFLFFPENSNISFKMSKPIF